MNKEQKKENALDLHDRFSRASVAILTDYEGMGVEELRAVRTEVRKAEGEFKVVKNTLAIRAALGTSLEGLSAYFKGSTAITIGYGDPVAPAKALKDISDKQKKLKIKGGVVEGEIVDLAGLRAIAELPSKDVLIATLVGRLQSPIFGFAATLNGVVSQFCRVLQSVQEKRESE